MIARVQRGLTLIGFVLVLIVVGIFGYFAMMVTPMYLEWAEVSKVMNNLHNDAKNGVLNSQSQLRTSLDLQLATGGVRSIGLKDFKFSRKGGLPVLSVKYEYRTVLVYNLDLVGRFEKQVELPGVK